MRTDRLAPRSMLHLCRSIQLGLGSLLLLLASACQGDHLTRPALIDPAVLYWQLVLNERAVTLSTAAPYDTLTVTATPRNQAGEALSDLPAPEFYSTDPERVVVTANGTLVAAQVTADPVAVVATLTTDNLKHVDTVLVRVVDAATPPVVHSLTIQPVPPDSAKVAMDPFGGGGFYSYPLNNLVRATDEGGAPITDLLVSFRVSDTATALVQYVSDGNGMAIFSLVGRRPGTVKLDVSTTVFGITKVDTIAFRVGYPLLSGVPMGFRGDDHSALVIASPAVTVGVGGLVFWGTNVESDVTFTDSLDVAPAMAAASHFPLVCFLFDPCDVGGNIPPFTGIPIFGSGGAARAFPVPGTYEYRSVSHSDDLTQTLIGKVVVVDER